LLGEHILTALLDFFSLLADVGRDLAGFGARLGHPVFYSFSRLIAEFHAL